MTPASLVSWIQFLVGCYLATGLVLAVPFLRTGLDRLDPAAGRAGWGFRLVILPGVAVLWPLLLRRSFRAGGGTPPPGAGEETWPSALRRRHGTNWVVLALVMPLLGGAAWMARPEPRASVLALPQPETFPTEVGSTPARHLPLTASLRESDGRLQVQLTVSEPPSEPLVAVYWTPDQTNATRFDEAVFLGSLQGPSRQAFDLPHARRSEPGTLVFLALSGKGGILETLPLPR